MSNTCPAYKRTFRDVLNAINPDEGDNAMCIVSAAIEATMIFASAITPPELREQVKADVRERVDQHFDKAVAQMEEMGQEPWQLNQPTAH